MKTINNQSNLTIAAGLAALIALATASTPSLHGADQPPTPEQAAARMATARTEIAITRSNIVLTLEQLDLIRSAADPRAQYQKFTEQLAIIEKRAQLTRERGLAMKTRADAYFADWEAQVAGIQDPARRQQVQASYATRKKSYDRIVEFMQTAGKDFAPLLSALKEIQQLLQGTPTREQVAAAKDLFMRANWRCADVQRSLMEAEREFGILAADVAGSTDAAAPGGKDKKAPAEVGP